MGNKPADKIVEALTQLLEGFHELHRTVAEELGGADVTSESTEIEDPELEEELHAAVATELRAALETVMEDDQYSVEDMAALVSSLSEAIEEIDPDVFASGDEDEDSDDYDEDFDIDDEEFEDIDKEEDDDDDDKEKEDK